jgi:hypothetical protein
MSGGEHPIEWYLAREGQQYGPLSDAELRKFVELGHMRPNDLLWRHGFPEWRPAANVFPPERSPAAGASAQTGGRKPANGATGAAAAQAARSAPQTGAQGSAPSMRDPKDARQDAPRREAMPRAMRQRDDAGTRGAAPEERRRFPWVIAALVLILGGLGGTAYVLHRNGQLAHLTDMLGLSKMLEQFGTKSLADLAPKQASESPAAVVAQPVQGPEQAKQAEQTGSAESMLRSPLEGFSNSPEAVDTNFQKTALWQLLKREFPDWYAEQVKAAAQLRAEQKDDTAIAQKLAEALVALRRKHVTEALAASPQRLRLVASTFLDNLGRLAAYNINSCYGFISQGETSPAIVELMRAGDYSSHLQAQVVAVFEAIAEGRRSPQQHPAPRREDYDALFTQLSGRGWGPGDLQLFSDARALSKASPQKVCQMVQDWFAAQLAVKDDGSQVRLLVEALKPVVAG